MSTFTLILRRLTKIYERKSIRYAIPFLLLVVGGSFGLKEFAQLRYQFARRQPVNPQDVEKYGLKMKEPSEVTLESEYEKVKKLNIDSWSQKRGPRPWEDPEEEVVSKL